MNPRDVDEGAPLGGPVDAPSGALGRVEGRSIAGSEPEGRGPSADVRAFLDLDPLPQIVTDDSGAVLFANRAAQRQWRVDREVTLAEWLGLTGRHWTDLVAGLVEDGSPSPVGDDLPVELARVPLAGSDGLILVRQRERRSTGGHPGELRQPSLVGIADLRAENARLVARNRRLSAALDRDALTGVGSRRALLRTLSTELRALRVEDAGLGVLMIDVDHFKRLNDAAGHLAGDRALKAVSEVLSGAARRARDMVGRLGGEEFCVVLPGVEAGALQWLAEQVRVSVESRQISHPDSPIGPWVTACVGAAWFAPGEAVRSRDALEQADRALYAAKLAGRNRVAVARASA